VGVVNCTLVRADGTLDHAAKTSFPTLLGAIGHFTLIGRIDRSPAALTQYRATHVNGPGPVDNVSGAVMLLRKAALDQVGLFDEGYWLYAEDTDLCYRMWQDGWVVWHQSDVTITHLKGGTVGRYRNWRQIRSFHAGLARFYRKYYAPQHHPVVNGFVYTAIGAKLLGTAALTTAASGVDRLRSRVSVARPSANGG
jgi:GT2 family glycosyltransferase